MQAGKADLSPDETILGSYIVQAAETVDTGLTSQLSNLDLQNFPCNINLSLFYAYSEPIDAIKAALGATLARYPLLSGRITTDQHTKVPYVALNNAGVPLTHVTRHLALDHWRRTGFSNEQVSGDFAVQLFPDQFLMTLRATFLQCGGLVLQFAFHHHVCDINSVHLFITDFAQQLKNGQFRWPVDPQEVALSGSELFAANDKPFEDFNRIIGPAFDLTPEILAAIAKEFSENPRKVARLHLTNERLRQIKGEACKDQPDVGFVSTNDILAALLWRATLRARGEPGDKRTVFSMAVNIRCRLQPRLPISFFGNALVLIAVDSSVSEILAKSIYQVAQMIRAQVNRVDNDYVLSFVNFMQAKGPCGIHHDFSIVTDGLAFTNWNNPHFEWYEDCDLGRGPPEKIINASTALNGLAIVLPHESDGFEVLFGLLEKHFNSFILDQEVRLFFGDIA